MNFRFFIAESNLWDVRVKRTLDQIRERNKVESQFKEKYEAAGFYQHGKAISGLGWETEEKRKGWIFVRMLPAAGENYYCYKPDKRTKIGREAATSIDQLNLCRVSGFFRPVQQWNRGKKEEFKDRLNYNVIGEENGQKGK